MNTQFSCPNAHINVGSGEIHMGIGAICGVQNPLALPSNLLYNCINNFQMKDLTSHPCVYVCSK